MLSRGCSFVDSPFAIKVLLTLEHEGSTEALKLLYYYRSIPIHGPLLDQLYLILTYARLPVLLIDSIWFNQSYGGISRVWDGVLKSLRFFHLDSTKSSVIFVDRGSSKLDLHGFRLFKSSYCDPHDLESIPQASSQNRLAVESIQPDIFCSSWITTTCQEHSVCPELLVHHDCLPELYPSTDTLLTKLRRRWFNGATSSISVSADSRSFLERFAPNSFSNHWCHLAPDPLFCKPLFDQNSVQNFLCLTGLPFKFYTFAI